MISYCKLAFNRGLYDNLLILLRKNKAISLLIFFRYNVSHIKTNTIVGR